MNEQMFENPRLFIVLLTAQSCMKQLVLHKTGAKQDGGKLNGYQCKLAITRERRVLAKSTSQIAIYSRGDLVSCLRCGVEVNAVPDDRMNEEYLRNPRQFYSTSFLHDVLATEANS